MNTIRNPFPAIGKVIKYEFLHSSRRLLPLYGVLLILGLVAGLTANPAKFQKELEVNSSGFSLSYSTASNEAETAAGAVSGGAFFTLVIASVIITVFVLENRFKKSMLGEEAYLNLSLPVTIGEHLWGRVFASVLWDLICAAVILLSFFLCYATIIHQDGGLSAFMQSYESFLYSAFRGDVSKAGFIINAIVLFVAICLMITNFTFLVDSFAHLFKKNKGLLQFVCAIAIIYITIRLVGFISRSTFVSNNGSFYLAILVMLAISGIYFAGTYFIFAKKLNLE